MRYTASLATYSHIYLRACFMFEKLFQTFSRRACSEDWRTYQITADECHTVSSVTQNSGDADTETSSSLMYSPKLLGEIAYTFYPHPRSRLMNSTCDAFGPVPTLSESVICLPLVTSIRQLLMLNSIPPSSAKLSKTLNVYQRICDKQGPVTDLGQLLWGHAF